MGFTRLVEECLFPYEVVTGSLLFVEPVGPVAEGLTDEEFFGGGFWA